jgi:predicted N-acetyltransferase YhbS
VPAVRSGVVTVRLVTPADAEAVRAVLVETWHATYDVLMGADRVTAITDDWHAVERLRRQCGVAGSVFLLAEVGDAVVGTVSMRCADDGLGLDRLYVAPGWQGRGIGALLLREAVRMLGDAEPIRVEVHAGNAASIAFYAYQGFVPVGREGEDLVMRRPGRAPG